MNDRVPPGQHLVSNFPVLHVGPVPPFEAQTWRLRVFGLVQEERNYTYAEITSGTPFPRTTVQADFHCVTTWSKLDNTWGGIKCIDLTTNIPLTDLKRDDVLLAWGHNGADLSPEHGYPLRLLVPHLYGWKSAKWLHSLEFMAEDAPGFWEQRGYHMYGDPWCEQRYSWD